MDSMDRLRARDVVAVHAAHAAHAGGDAGGDEGAGGGYELAYLTRDASTGLMIQVAYIRTGECTSCFKAEVLCLVRRQWDGEGLVLDKLEIAEIEAAVARREAEELAIERKYESRKAKKQREKKEQAAAHKLEKQQKKKEQAEARKLKRRKQSVDQIAQVTGSACKSHDAAVIDAEIGELCAHDVVAIQSEEASGYVLAYLTGDASTDQMLGVEYIRTRESYYCDM